MKKIEEIKRIETNQEKLCSDVIHRMDEIIKTVADALCCPERRLRGMTKAEWDLYCADRRNNVI